MNLFIALPSGTLKLKRTRSRINPYIIHCHLFWVNATQISKDMDAKIAKKTFVLLILHASDINRVEIMVAKGRRKRNCLGSGGRGR
jgi:hypothetical protein